MTNEQLKKEFDLFVEETENLDIKLYKERIWKFFEDRLYKEQIKTIESFKLDTKTYWNPGKAYEQNRLIEDIISKLK